VAEDKDLAVGSIEITWRKVLHLLVLANGLEEFFHLFACGPIGRPSV
jgi:hypothetical protein